MNRNVIILFLFGLLLLGCQPRPAEVETDATEPESGVLNQHSNETEDSDVSDGPSATAEIQFVPTEEKPEDYPEPETEDALVDAAYPEPQDSEVKELEESDLIIDNDFSSEQGLPVRVPEGISGEGDVQVVFVSARQSAPETWTFNVTLEHADTGWDDYADGWDVVLPDGNVIKPRPEDPFTRLLLHPHENEQPFTRSQSGINIPAEIGTVYVRAHETVEGYGSEIVVVDLSAASGDRFEVVK